MHFLQVGKSPWNSVASSQESVTVASSYTQRKQEWKLLSPWSTSKTGRKMKAEGTQRDRSIRLYFRHPTNVTLLYCIIICFPCRHWNPNRISQFILCFVRVWLGGERALKFHVTHARVGCYSMKVLFTHKSIRSSVSLAQRRLFKRSMGTWKNLNLEGRIPRVQCCLLLVSRVCAGLWEPPLETCASQTSFVLITNPLF